MKVLVLLYAFEANDKFLEKYQHGSIYLENYLDIVKYAVEDCGLYAAARKKSDNMPDYDYLVFVDTKMFRQR